MEDSFGVGADYLIINDKVKASVDAWQFEGDPDVDAENPHVKVTASYTVFKAFFINAGVDNAANQKSSSAFTGVGLTFDDEDLKYIMTRLPISLP